MRRLLYTLSLSAAAPHAARGADASRVVAAPSTVVRVSTEGPQIEAGVDLQILDPARPRKSSHGWNGGQLIIRATAARDTESGRADFSAATSRIGARAELTYQRVFSDGRIAGKIEGAETATVGDGWRAFHMFSAGLNGEWKAERFEFHPLGGDKFRTVRHDFKAGAHLRLFTPISRAQRVPSRPTPGAPADNKVTDHGHWLSAPQVRVSFGRVWKAADEQILVDQGATPQGGFITAEQRRIEGPSAVPELAMLVALPFEPPRGTWAFGPAAHFRTSGLADAWVPTGSSRTIRVEFWGYYYANPAADKGTFVRIGLAPYVQHGVRPVMGDLVRETVFGAMLELRTGTLQLQY